MERRTFTKIAGVSMASALAGCSSLNPQSEDDGNESTDAGSPSENEDLGNDSTETESDEETEADTDQNGNRTEQNESDTSQENESSDQNENQTDDQDSDDEQPADNETGNETPPTTQMDAEISMDSELEDLLEVVHHEFGWESGQGSHLCTINFEVRNASSTHDIWFDAVGEVVDENGTAVGGDVIQFGLHPQEEKANTFSVDNCAAAAKYRITFEARGVSESSNTGT